MRFRRLAVTAAVLAVSVALVGAGAWEPVGAALARKTAAADWDSCPGQPQFQCATVRVPLDYDEPNGTTTPIALIRWQAPDQAHRLGSVFFNPGGPGGSGVASLPIALATLPSGLQARYDVIGFDPRGINQSDEVQCFDSFAQEVESLNLYPGVFPYGIRQQLETIGSKRRFGGQCASRGVPLLSHMSTANVARDLDRLRQAVGDAKLNYFGISYGTYLGATYANLFPGKVGRMVLDSNIDPLAWAGLTGAPQTTFVRLGSDLGAADTIDEFVRLCGDVPVDRCAFSAGTPQATGAKLNTLLDRLKVRQVKLPFLIPPPFDDGFSYAELTDYLVNQLKLALPLPALGVRGWPGVAEIVQQLWLASEQSAADGPTGVRVSLRPDRVVKAFDAMPGLAGPNPPYGGFETSLGVICSDSPHPRNPLSYPALDAAAFHRSGPSGSYYVWLDHACAQWAPPADADRYRGPFDKQTSGTILVVGVRHDPATAYHGSVVMARTLGNAQLLTLDGYGHTALLNQSRCIDDFETAYFATGQLPPYGQVCRQDTTPF